METMNQGEESKWEVSKTKQVKLALNKLRKQQETEMGSLRQRNKADYHKLLKQRKLEEEA